VLAGCGEMLDQQDPLIAALAKFGDGSGRVEGRREYYVFVLRAVAEHISRVRPPGYKAHIKQLYELALALEDLDRGIVDPLLKPSPVRGKKPANASSVWERRGRIALGVEALISTGINRKQAAKKAARDFPAIRKLAGIEPVKPRSTETMILSWYDHFKQGKVRNSQAFALFHHGCEELQKLVARGDPDVADRLKQVARALLSKAAA